MTAKRKVYKTSINLSEDAVRALEQIARDRGETVANVIRKAISTESFLHEATVAGSKILIEDKDRSLRQLVFR
jgi:predicted transcriptional regulator